MARVREPPPPYFAGSDDPYQGLNDDSLLPKYDSLPPEFLALTPNPISASRLFISGSTRTPDLTISTDNEQDVYRFETDSTLVYHETFVKDLRGPRSLFRIRRHTVQWKSDDTWRYTIQTSSGSKILEVETDPGMLSNRRNDPWSTRLIFRNVTTSDLDGLTLCMRPSNTTGSSMSGEISYQGKRVADIVLNQRREPGYEVRIFRDEIDPLLVVILAYIIDDRTMDSKRRNRRARMSGFAGIGKGPGAGLAGLYGLGSLM